MAISRDVKFGETNFPFAQLKPKNSISGAFETPSWQEADWVKQVAVENNKWNATTHLDSQTEPTKPTSQTEPTEPTSLHIPVDLVGSRGET